MNLKDGDRIEVGGETGIVCFTTEFEGDKYICVAFENENPRFEIYEYKYENEKLLVGKVEDEEEMKEVLKLFFQEGIEKNGLPDNITSEFEKLIQDNEE